jgi:hypothetical protein
MAVVRDEVDNSIGDAMASAGLPVDGRRIRDG